MKSAEKHSTLIVGHGASFKNSIYCTVILLLQFSTGEGALQEGHKKKDEKNTFVYILWTIL